MKENPFTTRIIQNNEQNIFGATSQTDSTVADSMYSSSLVGLGSVGKASFVDFSMCYGFRTSIASKRPRRGTELLIREEVRESEGSINDRGSSLEEGQVNKIDSVVPLKCKTSPVKCYSDVKVEEFKDSVEGELRPVRSNSNRSGSGSGRLHNGIKSFIDPITEADDSSSPFASVGLALSASGELNVVEDEDDCNAEDTEEHVRHKVPVASPQGQSIYMKHTHPAYTSHESK